MKKTILRVVSIVALLGGALIGKYIEDNKSEVKENSVPIMIDSGYLQDEYQESEPNYDENFEFPRELDGVRFNGNSGIIIKNREVKDWISSLTISDKYRDYILKTGKIRDKNDEYSDYLVKGYIHEYIFPDFGITIKTSNPADNEEFFTKNPSSFQRYTDNIYDVITQGKSKYFYIRRYPLETGSTFNKEYLEKHNSFTGTSIVDPDNERDQDDPIFNTGLVHFYQETTDGSYSNGVGADEAGNQTVIYLYNPKLQPNYYYKVAYTNACAPSCGLPEKIDIIASK